MCALAFPWQFHRRKENEWLQQEAQKVRVESVSSVLLIAWIDSDINMIILS